MTRLGIHCNTMGHADKLIGYYRRTQAPVLKTLVFDDRVIHEVKRVSPGTKCIGRLYTSRQKFGAEGGRWVRELVEHARAHPGVDYWEGYNEVGVFDLGELERYADFELDRMRQLRAIGRHSVVGNFSTGTLGSDQLRVVAPMLREALAHGEWFGIHEYSGPFMQWMAGGNQWDHERHRAKRIDDPCLDPSVTGWTTLRYRTFFSAMQAHGLGPLPIVITEGGIDDVNPRPGPQGKGYKDWIGTEWAGIPGIGDYADQQHWYYWQLSHDGGKSGRPLVVGGVDFGWATEDPAWNSFDLATDDGMRERVIRRQCELPVGHADAGEPPRPPLLPPALVPGPDVRAMIVPRDGEGWAALAGRAYGQPGASYGKRLAWARMIADANGATTRDGLALRSAWLVPGARVVPDD